MWTQLTCLLSPCFSVNYSAENKFNSARIRTEQSSEIEITSLDRPSQSADEIWLICRKMRGFMSNRVTKYRVEMPFILIMYIFTVVCRHINPGNIEKLTLRTYFALLIHQSLKQTKGSGSCLSQESMDLVLLQVPILIFMLDSTLLLSSYIIYIKLLGPESSCSKLNPYHKLCVCVKVHL